MALIWQLAIPLPAHLSLILFGFLAFGAWTLFSRYHSQTKVAAKTEALKQHNLKQQIQKLTVSQPEEIGMNFIEADLTCISGLPMGWTQEYIFWSIDRSLRQIFQHLENARSTLMELSLSEPHEVSSSSISDLVAQEVVSPCPYCKKGKRSFDHSISSGSSKHSLSLSYLPAFSEEATGSLQSSSVSVSPQNESSVSINRDTSLPAFQLIDSEKSNLFQNLLVLPPLQAQSSFTGSILESLDPCKQKKTKGQRKNRLISDRRPSSVLNESPGPLVWGPLQLSPLVRRELEGHMSQKVSTLREQAVPLPVRNSWEILNQLPIPIPQSTEQNTNRSSAIPLFHLHMNIDMNSESNKLEAKMSQPLTSKKQSQSEDDCQIHRYNPLVISMDTPSPRNLGLNIIQEETTFLKKDPKHLLELSIEQRAMGLPEKRIQPHKAQVTNVERTPTIPCSATDSIKVTPLALLQVMDSMGMIPESHLEMIESVGFPQPPNQAETVNMTPQSSDQVTESVTVSPQHQTMESMSMPLRLDQVRDNMKVTPVALFHVMDSMGMVNELCPHVIESVTPKLQYQVTEPVKMDTWHNYQAVKPGQMSPGQQHIVMETVEIIPQPQYKVMETVNIVPGSHNQAPKHVGITPSPIHQNTVEISSTPLHQVIDYTEVTPVAQQTMGFMQIIPSGQLHSTEAKGLTQGSQPQATNLTLMSAPADVLTTSAVPVGAVESRSLLPQPPSKVLESSGMILQPSDQSIHALKVTPTVQMLPTGMIAPLQVVESSVLIQQTLPQAKESLALPSGLQVQVRDSVGMIPHQGTEYVSLTPGLPHQVTVPLNLSPRQSHKMTETMGLTSETWPQMKTPIEMTQSHHKITESMRTIPDFLDQDTVSIEMSQKHQVTEFEVVPAIPLLQEIEYLDRNSTPQPKVTDSINLSSELQNVKSENLVLDSRLQSMKSVDVATDLAPEMVKYELLTSTVLSKDLAPELHQQNIQSEELTPTPPLQTEKSVPSAPESQLQDMKSGQLTVGPHLQNVQSAGLAPDPQLQSNKSVNFPYSSQSMEDIHSALRQELQGDIKMVELTPLEDTESVNLFPKPCSKSTSSDNLAQVPLLEDTKTPLVECRSLVPEAMVESIKVGELIPSTPLYAVKSDPSYHVLEPKGLALQATETRVTSDTCHQAEETVGLTQSSLGMTPAPPSQTLEPMRMSSPLQDTLESRTQVVKEMEVTLKSQNTIKVTLDLLPESELQNMNSEVVAPEPQPTDVKLVHMTLEPCSEVTNPSETTLRSECKDTETDRLTLPKVDSTWGTSVEPYSEVGSPELSLEPGLQCEKSESSAQKLKSAELISEPSILVVEPTELTTGPKLLMKDVVPGPQLHTVKSSQMDTESQLQNEKSVNLIQQSSTVDPEKTKPEPGIHSLPPKELIEGSQPPNVNSVDLNLGPQQPHVKSGLIPGPQLPSIRFPKLYQGLPFQGEKPVNLVPGSQHYSVKSDEAATCSPVPEIRPSHFIPGPKFPVPQPQHEKSVEVNLGQCLQDVRFSDLTPEPMHQGFKYIQFISGVQIQDRKPQGFMPESFLPLSQEPQVEDTKLVLPTKGSEFHSTKFTTPASELQHPSVVSEELSPGLRQQDNAFSELASKPKLQGIKFEKQTPGLAFHGVSSMTPELGIHDPTLAKLTPGLQDPRQVSFNSGSWLQDVKYFDLVPGTQPQGAKTSKFNSEPQLECVKIFELTTQPERQGMKPELVVQEPWFQNVKYDVGTQVPSYEGERCQSYKLALEPQIPNVESKELTPEIHLARVDHSELIRRPQVQGIESSKLIQGQHLGYVKPVEKITVSKQEELASMDLTPGPHLGDMKSMELRSKSELGQVKSMLLTPGIQAGNKKLEDLPPGSKCKGLKSELLPSRPQLEDREAMVLTLGQCLEKIKSTAVSPSSFHQGGMKLIPGSRIQDLKTVGLAHDTHVQHVNAKGLKLGPKKQRESPVTFVPGKLFQMKSMEVLQGPQLQDIKPKQLTSQPQMQDKNLVNTPCLKQQRLIPRSIPKTQGIQGVKFVNLASTRECPGLAPVDLTLEPEQNDQIPEWKDGIFNQLNKQLEPEDTLSLGSVQEPKSADIKPIEINSKVQFKDKTSFEMTPKPVDHNVKTKEFQYEPQVPSTQPCQLTPGSQMHQVRASESTLEPQIEGMKTMVPNTEPQIGSTKSIQWIPISEFQSEKCIRSNFRSQFQGARPTKLKPSAQWRGVRSSELTVRSKIQGKKSVEFQLEPQLQQVKTSPLARGLQKPKTFNLISEPQPQGIKTVALNKETQAGNVRTIQWIPRPEFHGVKSLGLNSGSPSQSQSVKHTEWKPFVLGGMEPSGRTLGTKPQGKKSVDFNLEPQVQSVETPGLSPGSELQEGRNFASPSEPQLQGIKTAELNKETQVGSVRSSQWIPGPEFHGVNFFRLNYGSPFQSVKSAEWKPSIQLGGTAPSERTLGTKPQGKKSVGFNLEPQVQSVEPPGLSPGSELQEGRNFASPSEPQLQGIKTAELNKETQVGSVRSSQWIPGPQFHGVKSLGLNYGFPSQSVRTIQWLPGPEFHGVKSLGLNSGSPSPSVKHTEQKPFVLGGAEPSERTLGTKPQGKKSVDFNLKPQVQSVETPGLFPGSELQEGGNFASPSEPESQCVKIVTSHRGPQLENTKSVQWIPVSDFQVQKSMPNLGLQSQDVTAKELKVSVQLRDVKMSELTPKPKLQGRQLSASVQEYQPHGLKPIDFKSELQFGSMKACDPTLRSEISNIKSMTFKPGFHLEDRNSPELAPGIQPQEMKPLESALGTQPQDVTPLVFKQESQPSEVKYEVLSQGPQSQNNKNIELKTAKSSELSLQTKPHGVKSEFNSGQWQSTKCSDLTPETKTQNMKHTKLSPSSQLIGKPCADLIMETMIKSVKQDSKHGPKLQDIKYEPVLRTKPQEVKMEDCESGPQLQDLKSSRMIMGIKVQDVKSLDFGPGPHLQDMTSAVIMEKELHGVKSKEIKPSMKLQGEKPDFTQKRFPSTKSAGQDSDPRLQDLKYPELIMGTKLQGVKSVGQHFTSITPSEVMTGIKSQGVKAVDFNSGPQTQITRPSELVQGEKLQDMESVKFSQCPKLQGMTAELILETTPPNEESVKLNSGFQLQDEKYSESILGTKLQDGRSLGVSSGPHLQDVKSSEVTSGDKFQKEKLVGLVNQPLWQDVKSFQWNVCNTHERKPFRLKLHHKLQDRKLSMLTPELHRQGTKAEAFNPGLKLKGVKSEPINLQIMKDKKVNHGTELQVEAFSELASEPYEKSHKLSQMQQLQSIKSIVLNQEPHLYHINLNLHTKLQDLKSMEFNSKQQLQKLGLGTGMQSLGFNPEPQLQETKPSEVYTETKLLDESSPEFKHEPRLQGRKSCELSPGPQMHCKNAMAYNTGTQDVELSKLHPGPDLQSIKSKVFCLGPHLEDVNSACTPNANSQYINPSGREPGPYLQYINSPECIPEPTPQSTNPMCNSGPGLHGMIPSACISEPKLQSVDSAGYNPEPHLQNVNSSLCTPGLSPQCVNSSTCSPEPSPQCVNLTECIPKSHLQGVTSPACTPGQNPQCVNSNRYTFGPYFQGTTFPTPQILYVNPVLCDTKTHLQIVNSSPHTLRQESQCVNSTGRSPGPHLQVLKLQGIKSPELNPDTELQREMSKRVSPGQHLQELETELTPGSNFLGVAPIEYNPGPQVQCVKSSESNPELKLQCINLVGDTLGPHLQGIRLVELTPETKAQSIFSGPQLQGMDPSEFNPEPKFQCINSVKLSSGPQLQNMKSFELTPGSESQCTKSVRLNFSPPFQGRKSSNSKEEAKIQEILFLKNQLGSRKQSTQPMFTLRPQSADVKSTVVLPAPLVEDRKSPEVSKQPLLCTNSIKPTQGFSLQDLRSKAFSPEPCFQKANSVKSKPRSQSQIVDFSELISCHRKCAKSSFASKPCFQDRKPMQLRLGSQQQSTSCHQFPLGEKPMVLAPESTRKFLAEPVQSHGKASNLISEPQQQCMKSSGFTAEPKCQSVKHERVCLPQTVKSVEVLPRSFHPNVVSGNKIPRTSDQITEPSNVAYRPGAQLVDCPEISMKTRHQVPKLVSFTSLSMYQDVGASEMTKGLRPKSTETTEKSARFTPKPTEKVIDSLGMPLQLSHRVPEFVDRIPTLSDQDSKSSKPLERSCKIPGILKSHSWSYPQCKDFKELQTKQVTDSGRMTPDLKNHAAKVMTLTCEAGQQGKAFLRATSEPVNRETGGVEKSPRPCPQGLGPVAVSSEKRSQREQSVVSPPKPFYHVSDSASGKTPTQGPQTPESICLTSKSTLQTSQFGEIIDSVELTFETWKPQEVAARLAKPQTPSMDNASVTPIESLEQMIKFVSISPKPLDQVTQSVRTQHRVAFPKAAESVEVIPGPPLQVVKSVMIPEPTSQVAKYADLTPKQYDEVSSDSFSRFWLQNVQSKKLIAEPTHRILEKKELLDFQIIKTVLIPKPLLLIVRSEELAPGPSPQATEPIGVTIKSSIKVKDCLNLLPRPHLQDQVKPMELTPKANIQVVSTELILQQTSPLEEPPVLTQERKLQAEKSLGIKTESPKVKETEDLNQGQVCQNRNSEMITSEKLQTENYLPTYVHNPSIQFISSFVKTPELGHLQGSQMPEVSRALAMKNRGVGILQSAESYMDNIMIRPSDLSLTLHDQLSDKTENIREIPYPKIWEVGILSSEEETKKHVEELEKSLQSYTPHPLRLLPVAFQAGFGARRSSIRSFLGRQQNIWESHVSRQRLPRKYLSNMLMLGNVLGTTMEERKLCSQPFLTGSTPDICRSVQNLFGVPAELMEFSQSLLEKGPRMISQSSVVKNYIQRHILCNGQKKRVPLRIWTRSSTSSIIQQYSGTKLGIKKTNSKLSNIFQEVTQHVTVSCTGDEFPALMKSESALEILYNREKPVPREQSKNLQSNSPTRTYDSHHSLKASYLCQAKTNISEQLNLLKDMELKIAAKLLRSQIPHNVPPPLASGLVLKYPICLQCGRCSGFSCCHKLQPAFGPYLLIYPQLHLLSTPEGRGEIRLHLGFRLRIGKRPQVSKYRGRNRADTWKNTTSPPRRKAKTYTPACKSPTPIRDFKCRSSQSPAFEQIHVRQKQWSSHRTAGKTETKESGHYEFCQVHSLSESGFESKQDEKWANVSLKKMSDLKYPMKKTTTELKTQNTRLYKNSRTTESSSGTLMNPSRSKSIDTTQTSTVSSKRQSKKSSQPKFMHLLFQSLRQAFQTAHRITAAIGQKPEDRARLDKWWSSKSLQPKQKLKDHCLTGESKGASLPAVTHRSTGLIPKQEDILQKISNQCRQAQELRQESSFQPRPLQLQKTMVCERDVTIQESSVIQPLNIIQNVSSGAKENDNETSSPESKNCSQAKCQAQEKNDCESILQRTLYNHFTQRDTYKDEQHGFFRERARRSRPSERTHHSLSERRHHSPSQRKDRSPSYRGSQSLSERNHQNLSKGRSHSPSERRQHSPSGIRLYRPSGRSHHSPSGRRHHSPSGRSLSRRKSHSPSGRSSHSSPVRRGHKLPLKNRLYFSVRSQCSPYSQRCCSPSKRSHLSPTRRTQCSPSERSHGSLSEKTPFSPSSGKRHSSGRTHRSPSKTRLHRPSRPNHSHSARTHYSPSESTHGHSERSQHKGRPHHGPRERLKHGSPKERPRYSFTKEFKTYLSMSSRDHTTNSKSWTSLET